ncbi:IS630 family transposase [Cohnella rhizosphaerae]|uniref:IS630 family transposase n=1 Tax=Cohnella rhizosphaerae TaxID=1457232 RepID=A0A9X4KN37_9BACL|nr:IS630 family transposase [Cohnella rhizosphaerae]MDG0808071.1 IS630 family transposase [Cohnella rhizosphaerae]
MKRKERKILYHWKQGQSVEYRLKFRATLVWEVVHERKSIAQVAREQGTTTKTVSKWNVRFEASGSKGLHDRPRSGAPSTFSVEQRCEVIALACDSPRHYGSLYTPTWTLDRLTEVARVYTTGPTMSRSSIHLTLQRNDLKPHAHQMWLHSRDPQFREKVHDVVSLYVHPPEDAVVICVDEMTSIQALERKHPTKSAHPGRAARYEQEYIRHGTRALLAGFEITTGHVIAQCRKTRKAVDLMALMEELATVYPDQRVIIIWDNLNIHYDGATKRWTDFNRRHGERFEFHYTPLHASWVNQIEIFFSIIHKRCLRHGDFRSGSELEAALRAFIRLWNEDIGHPFHWTFGGYPMQSQPQEAS